MYWPINRFTGNKICGVCMWWYSKINHPQIFNNRVYKNTAQCYCRFQFDLTKSSYKAISHFILKIQFKLNKVLNSSLISKVESRKLAGALDSCFVLFGTLQQCAPTEPGGNRTRDLTVRKPVSNRCAASARSRLEFSTSPINDVLREVSSIVLYIILTYRGMVGPKIHDFPLDDQFTVDFIHPISW